MKKFLSYILALTQLLNAFAYAEGPTKNEFQKAEALRLLLLFNKAGSLYKEKGPDAWVSNFDFLEDSEINFVKQTLSKLVALPSLSFDESNNTFYLSLDNSKTSLSLTDKENVFLLNSEKFTINSSENIEALYQRLILILSPKKSAYFNVFSFLPSAHAISGLAVTGIAIAGALLLACLFKNRGAIKQNLGQAMDSLHSNEPREYSSRFNGVGGWLRGGDPSGTKNSSKFQANGEWRKTIENTLNKYRNSFLYKVPPSRDMPYLCPNFGKLSEDEKKQVWISIFDSMSFAESGHNPNDVYREQNGTISGGLFALSDSDKKHGEECASLSVYNSNSNAACAVRIMQKQLTKYNTIFFNGSNPRANGGASHYYWSVLSPGLHAPANSGHARLRSRLNYLMFKQKDAWPTQCGNPNFAALNSQIGT